MDFRRPLLVAILGVCAVFVSPGIAAAADEGREKYEGKTAGEWIELLQSTEEFDRRRACYALGQIRPVLPEAVIGVAAALKDDASEPRWYAADALAQLGPEAKAAVPQLVAALESTANDETVHRAVAKALGNIGPDAAEAKGALEKTAAATDPQLRVASSLALWKITGMLPHLKPITDAIKSPDKTTAYAGLLALREVGLPGLPGAKFVVTCLRHADSDVRRAAVKTLSSWGLAAVPVLLDALNQPEPETRVGAATAVTLVLDDVRRNLLDRPDADPARRDEARAAITGQLLPGLMPHLSDPTPTVAASVRRAVAMIGPPALPALLAAVQSAKPAEREAAAATLREIEDYLPPAGAAPLAALRATLLPTLLAALKSPERTTRNAALRLFAALEIGPEGIAALPQLQAALKDEDVAVRSDAAQALDRVQKTP